MEMERCTSRTICGDENQRGGRSLHLEEWQTIRHHISVSILSAILAVLLVASYASSVHAVNCDGQVATIVGTAGADLLIGTAGPDVMNGLAGNDEIRGGNGNDVICGYTGSDVIEGGSGNDIIRGGPGIDWLFGMAGNDTIYGLDGHDRITGGSASAPFDFDGANVLRGGAGFDCMIAAELDEAYGEGDGDFIETIASDPFDLPFVDCGGGEDSLLYWGTPPAGRISCEQQANATGSPWFPQCLDELLMPVSGVDDGLAFAIDGVTCGLENVISHEKKLEASGQFCFIAFRLANEQERGHLFDFSCQVLVDEFDNEYTADADATQIVMERVLRRGLVAGEVEEEAGLVFDIPEGTVISAFRFHGSCDSLGVVVDAQDLDASRGLSAQLPTLSDR